MNIFILNESAQLAARDHCDKHIVKMILEYGQMLSTTHRLLDGVKKEWVVKNPETGKDKKLTHWELPGESSSPVLQEMYKEIADGEDEGRMLLTQKWVVEVKNSKCYKVAHTNHPCTVWTRQVDSNYKWLFQLFEECLLEYSRRYNKTHSASKIWEFISSTPKNIKNGPITPFAQAMPDEYKTENAVEAYRRFYSESKVRFAKWKYSQPPEWFLERTRLHVSDVS